MLPIPLLLLQRRSEHPHRKPPPPADNSHQNHSPVQTTSDRFNRRSSSESSSVDLNQAFRSHSSGLRSRALGNDPGSKHTNIITPRIQSTISSFQNSTGLAALLSNLGSSSGVVTQYQARTTPLQGCLSRSEPLVNTPPAGSVPSSLGDTIIDFNAINPPGSISEDPPCIPESVATIDSPNRLDGTGALKRLGRLSFNLGTGDGMGLLSIPASTEQAPQWFKVLRTAEGLFAVRGEHNRIVNPDTGKLTGRHVQLDAQGAARIVNDTAEQTDAIALNPDFLADMSELPPPQRNQGRPVFEGSDISFIQQDDKLTVFNNKSGQPLLKLSGLRAEQGVAADNTIDRVPDNHPAAPPWYRRLLKSIQDDYFFWQTPHSQPESESTSQQPPVGRDLSLRLSPQRVHNSPQQGQVARLKIRYQSGASDMLDFIKINDQGKTQISRLYSKLPQPASGKLQTTQLLNYDDKQQAMVLSDGSAIPLARVIVDDRQWAKPARQLSNLLATASGLLIPGNTNTPTSSLLGLSTGAATTYAYSIGTGKVSGPMNKALFLEPGQQASVFGTGPGGQAAAEQLFGILTPAAAVLRTITDKLDVNNPRLNSWVTNIGLGMGIQAIAAGVGLKNGAIANGWQAAFSTMAPTFVLIGVDLVTRWLRREVQPLTPEKIQQGLGRVLLFNVVNATLATATHTDKKTPCTWAALLNSSA